MPGLDPAAHATPAPARAVMPLSEEGWNDPHDRLIPRLFRLDDDELRCTYYAEANDALNGAVAAETLGFGWRLDAYTAPVSEDEDQREWRLVVWREYRSDALMRRPDDARGAE